MRARVTVSMAADEPRISGDRGSSSRMTVSSPDLRRRQILHFVIVNVGAAALAIAAIAWGFLRGVTWLDLTALLVMYFLTVTGAELGLHRFFSHRAFEPIRPLKILLAILGMMVGQGPVAYWVANHRRHHMFADRNADPHSPKDGLLRAHIMWVLDPNVTSTPRFARDWISDPDIRFLDRFYFVWLVLGLVLPGLIGWLITGSPTQAVSCALWGGGLRLFLVQHGIFCINSFCHRFGTRAFVTTDTSTNLSALTLPTLGGSLHHNHHAFAASATTAFFKRQIDFGGVLIDALASVGLVRHVNRPSSVAVQRMLADAGLVISLKPRYRAEYDQSGKLCSKEIK
jgi:stearoyl-CoA desaturase (delta-9 desaturase)